MNERPSKSRNARRNQDFNVKFQSAAVELNAPSNSQIESLKFRSSPIFHGYPELLKHLESLEVNRVKGEYQGNAWKVTGENRQSVLIVEHETGLEILYAIGAMASVVELIWKVASVWNRSRFRHFPDPDFERLEMERRKFDTNHNLIDEPVSSIEIVLLSHLLELYKGLDTRISQLEESMKRK